MRRYMEELRQRGELLVVKREVEAKHELAAVSDKVQRTLNKPLLFERVSGTELPVLTNLYGSRERLAGIVGVAPDQFCREWVRLGAGDGFAGPFTAELEAPADLIHGTLGDLPLINLCRTRRRALFHLRHLRRPGSRERHRQPVVSPLDVRQ